jgi:hypothetical protein
VEDWGDGRRARGRGESRPDAPEWLEVVTARIALICGNSSKPSTSSARGRSTTTTATTPVATSGRGFLRMQLWPPRTSHRCARWTWPDIRHRVSPIDPAGRRRSGDSESLPFSDACSLRELSAGDSGRRWVLDRRDLLGYPAGRSRATVRLARQVQEGPGPEQAVDPHSADQRRRRHPGLRKPFGHTDVLASTVRCESG